jgi:hypothetical protein
LKFFRCQNQRIKIRLVFHHAYSSFCVRLACDNTMYSGIQPLCQADHQIHTFVENRHYQRKLPFSRQTEDIVVFTMHGCVTSTRVRSCPCRPHHQQQNR